MIDEMEEDRELASYRRADLRGIDLHGTKQKRDREYLQRWAALYHLLQSIPNDVRFDMDSWGAPSRDSECNTAACAAGHAMLHPWFNERGLELGVARYSFGPRLDFRQEAWFGCNSSSDMPFDPLFCALALDRSSDARLTPSMVSEVTMAWMRSFWKVGEIDAVLEETAGVKYDIDYLHAHIPWAKAAEQEVKTP